MKHGAAWAALIMACTCGTPVSRGQNLDTEDDDVRAILQRMNARMDALERIHEDDQNKIKELEQRLKQLETIPTEEERQAQVEAIKEEIKSELAATSKSAQPPTTSAESELDALIASAGPAPAAQAETAAVMGSTQSAIQSFNPDISVNGNFLARYRSHEGNAPTRKFEFGELELGFSGAVDPYTRADVIATIGLEDDEYKADLEEAYMTFLQLPYNLQARLGKFRTEFGRSNPIHLHALPWTDYPFVIQRYFGEEGFSGTGGELSWLVPNPWNQYVSLTYELVNNDNDVIFAGGEADDVTQLIRLKTFRDLSPGSTLEWGASFATGPNDHGHGSHRSMVEGADLTYRWKPKGAGLYKSFLWQTEVLAGQADIRGGQESTWGMYSAAEYQFVRRWKLGMRYDNTQLPFESSLHENGYSAYLTFLQSEFLFWRLAYTDIDRNFRDEGVSDEQRVQLQLNFTLGAHPAHKY